MSLRRDVHAAFDQLAPSMGGLSDRVVQTVLAEGASRRRKEKMLIRMRAPLSLVAVFLLIALVAAVFIGGRLVQDWNALHRSTPAGSNSSELARLEAIPLRLPILKAGDTCPVNPGVNSQSYDYGSGPIYLNGQLLPEIRTARCAFYDLTYFSAPDLTGLVLVRGRDLKGGPISFVTGPASEASPLTGELILDAGHPPSRDAATRFGIWHVRHWIDAGWSGCWGFQMDGRNFSQTITGYVRPF